MHSFRISLCTTCMGRRRDLARTLPVNLELNAAYDNLEFVILDYNSRDGLGDWIQENMQQHLISGRVVYLHTDEPKYFSMTHSRNVAFKAASGDVVCNVDADNFTLDLDPKLPNRPRECFAERLNGLANRQTSQAIFLKGERLLRGRIALFRRDFIDVLGGYDEDLIGYGHDDRDLRERARHLGFTPYYFGGEYVGRIHTSRADKIANMEIRDWRRTQERNKVVSGQKLAAHQFKANEGRCWGRARLRRNFSEWCET